MKILVPFDGSEAAQNAIQYALKLAKSHKNSEVTILSVACYKAPYARDFSYTPIELKNACQVFFQDILAKTAEVFKDAGIVTYTITETGDAAEIIIDKARTNNYDKIVMGRRGLGSLAGLMLGSVSTKVLAHVDIPVTIVK
ncbi:universal stress protein [Desulforamulus aquiferis]|uniref:Universal stress protein n=1 Tax=Desulforamulus aquiferis TaxID=1397668 RepID=A0AAW7Z9V3_9FIRM|nr:universal stress protein [Desulforamulus aquiferis]MDO7786503.1 universal stress protein [Desulforamulus aquiferis]